MVRAIWTPRAHERVELTPAFRWKASAANGSSQTGAIGIARDVHLLYHPAETLCLPGLRIRFGTQKGFVITRARGRRV
jgi:hypothetical protein